jgi:hypothetical protein
MSEPVEPNNETEQSGNTDPPSANSDGGGLSRRGFLSVVFGAAGVLVLTVSGETVAPLKDLPLLAPRGPSVGPRGQRDHDGPRPQLPLVRDRQLRPTPIVFTGRTTKPSPAHVGIAHLMR